MSKKEQFITEVQTGIIIRKTIDNSESGPEAMWAALINVDDAFYASDRIPEEISAHEAACKFLEFIFKDSKEESYQPPYWIMRS